MPQQDKRLYPLTSYSIGIWKTPDKTKAYLLVLDQAEPTSRSKRLKTDQKRFVVLVTSEAGTRGCQSEPALSVNWLLGWMRQQITLRLRHKNPFADHTQEPDQDTSVLTFEVNWSNIVGMDFKWPLTEDPRLVLEAAVMSKRVFRSVEEVCLYYQAQPKASKGPRISLKSLLAANEQQQQQQHSGPSDSAAAAGVDSKQFNNKHHAAVMVCKAGHQHQQQVGNMSRVSSWASWASWQSGGRASLEQHQLHVPTAAEEEQPQAGLTPVHAPTSATPAAEQQHSRAVCGNQQHADLQAVDASRGSSFEQAWAAAAGCKPPQQYSRSCSFSSMSGMPGSLSTAPTLSAGIAAMGSGTAADSNAAGAAATASGAASTASWEGFGECPTPPLQPQHKQQQAADFVQLKGLRINTSSGSLAPVDDHPESACSGAGSPACAGAALQPAAIVAPASSSSAADTPTAFSAGARASLHAPPAAHPFRRLLEVNPPGCETAPCSMPNSPKVGLGGRTGSGYFSAALGAEESQQQQQQLLQGIQQPLQDLYQQQQEHQQQRSRHALGSSSGRSSSRLRAQACPLCQQPLVQPMPVLQQHFHQQQEARHRRSRSRGGDGSRSACSLEQLLQQAKAVDGSSMHSKGHSLQQLQQHSPGCESTCGSQVQAVGGNCPLGQEDKGPGALSSCAAAALAAASLVSSTVSATEPAVSSINQTLVAEGEEVETLTSPDIGLAQAVPKPADASASVYAGPPSGSAKAAAQEVTEEADTPCGAWSAEVGTAEQLQRPVDGQQESVYRTRTVIMTFRDPTLPHKLRQFVNSDVHLLKLYESGLPGWAIMLPSYGLYYRPVLRRVTWLLFVLLSVVSMAMGFYDLYKNVPYFKQVMVAMFRPAAAVFEWLEGHTQIRLSILLTYMLGRTQILVQLIKFLTQTSLQPIIGPLTTALAPLLSAISVTAATVRWLLQPLTSAVAALAGPISMLARLGWLLLQLVWQLVSLLLWSGPLQLVQAVAGVFMGLLQILLLPVQVLLPTAASVRAGWSAAKGAGQVARSAVPVVKSSAAAASSSWPMLAWYPLEALELMRVSTMSIMRALQAVVKFLVTLGSAVNQHRLSLMLQMRQQLRGGLRAAADSPAGRVATAVAVKMGQEQHVQRLQRRLHHTDSLVSVGSEFLGHADSVAVGTALSLDGELSVGMNGGLGEYSVRDMGNSLTAMAKADGDSDDEVTSALSEARDASPAELFSSTAGLRHRNGLGSQSSRYHSSAAGSGGKQVTFAAAGAQYVDGVAAIAVPPGQLPAAALRKSVDAAIAGSPFAFRPQGDGNGSYSSRLGTEGLNSPTAAAVGPGSAGSAGDHHSHSSTVGFLHQQRRGPVGAEADASAAAWPSMVTMGVRPYNSSSGPYSSQLPNGAIPAAAGFSAAQAGLSVLKLRRRNSWG